MIRKSTTEARCDGVCEVPFVMQTAHNGLEEKGDGFGMYIPWSFETETNAKRESGWLGAAQRYRWKYIILGRASEIQPNHRFENLVQYFQRACGCCCCCWLCASSALALLGVFAGPTLATVDSRGRSLAFP